MNAILKFLQALRSLYNQGAIKSIDEAMEFAKNEFGEITEFLEAQIKNVFKKAPEKKSKGIMDAEVIETSFKPGKSKYSDKIIEESESQKIARQRTDDLMGKTEESEGIMDIADKMSKKAEELKKMVDESKKTESSILEDALDAATGFRRAAGSKDKSKPFRTHSMEYKKENPDYRIPGGSMYAEGNLRTAIRQFLRTETKDGKLKLSEDDQWKIDNYSPMMADDPIDVFRRYYGEDALEAASDMADELRFGESYKHYEEIFRKEMPELKVKTEGAGQYDQSILDAERIMKEAAEEAKNKKILEDFDPTDRDKNATGGRAGYAFGSGLKLIKLLGGKKKLEKAIKEAVDDLNPTGDTKLDADMAVDNMLETYNIDRDAVDQYDIIDAYGKAYDELKLPIVNQLKNKRKPSVDEEQYYNVRNAVFDEVDKELEKQFPGVTEQIEAITKQSAASIKRDTIARRLGLDPFGLNEQQKMVLDKYGNKIDDDLLKNILIDDDPQRIAEVTATIDEAFIMQDKGMGPDEILETVKNTTRTKQADGTSEEGLSVMTELLQKAKIKKQKDADDNKQVRFRKLLASNKFPELNEFFEAELNEDDEKVELDVRTNLAVGGSPFTAEQLAQRKQQSYLDYLARQGVVGPSTSTGTTGTGTTGTGTTGVSVFTSPSSPAPSTGTGGTSSGTGGTSGGGTTSPGPASPGKVLTGSGGMTPGGGSSGGGSTGSSGGGTSSGGSNVYTGSGNLPPSMQTGSPTGSGSSLTPNTGNVNVGGGGFAGTGSIVGGGTGATGSEAIEAYKNYLKNQSGGSPLSFESFRRGTPYAGQLTFTSDNYDELQNIKKAVSGGYRSDGTYDRTMINNLFPDTGDLGSEAANIAANQAATGLKDPSTMSKKELRDAAQQYVEEAKAKWLAENPGATEEDFARGGGRWIDLAEDMVKDKYNEQQSATADDGFKDQSATADDGFEAQKLINDRLEKKYGDMWHKIPSNVGTKDQYVANMLAKDPEYKDLDQYSRQADLTSPRSDGKYADEVNVKYDKPVVTGGNLKKIGELALLASGNPLAIGGKLGKGLDLLAKGKKAYDTYNKGKDIYNQIKDAYNQSIDDVLTKPTGIGGQIDLNETLRVGKAVGGPIDLEARRKQSQADFLARQPGAQPAQPQAPTAQPVVPQPAQPAAPQPFDMSKYQGGYFGGGIEDSRNIALNNLAELGVDVSKYRTTKATDTSGPKFKGLSANEIFAMDLDTAKNKLGFDPSVQGANAEFEEFLKVAMPNPMAIGPGGPPGMSTEFRNQDELAQILNRAIPFYMRTARDLGENYTLQEMLAMTDEELAALEDRYDKKMGYGKYAKRSPNIQTGSRDKSQAQETMEYYSSNIKPKGTGIGLGSQYATGGRVGFRYGGDNARIKKYMKPSYDDPFSKLSNVDKRRFDAFNRLVLNKGRRMISTDKKKKRNLLTLNEKARAQALQRLNLLKKLYGRG